MAQSKKKNNKGLRVRVVDQYEKKDPWDEKAGYYANGEDNDYPQLVYGGILNSPTGVKAAGLMTKFIAGAGLVGEDVLVDPKAGTMLSDLRMHIARDFAHQYGCYIHRSIKLNIETPEGENQKPKISYETAYTKVLPFQRCRIGKKDSQDNLGKVMFGEYGSSSAGGFTFSKSDKSEETFYYPFSDNQAVIAAQIRADAKEYIDKWNKKNKGNQKSLEDMDLKDMIKHYRGQVLFVNLTPEFIYPVSRFDSVINDMDTEFRIGVWTNRQLRNGFLGKLMLLVASSDDEEGESLADQAEKWLGVENTGDIVIAEMDESVEDIDKLIHQLKLDSEYDEEHFSETPARLRKNILGAANNAPEALVFAGESAAMFGNSGEQLIQMQKFYQDQTQEERKALERTLRKLGYNVGIQPIIENATEEETTDENAKAQANLRGSVGGVQGILSIQASVAEGKTTKESAIETIVQIYGFPQETAEKMVGDPKIVGPNTGASQ